ncbi:MAG: hypothetical protein BWK78_08635 [Thiotrichaceae bacterium IS1]|nr:MAG: hypothetical protein BWK78_08635 [Thiotrichaceae bacterium IS1]
MSKKILASIGVAGIGLEVLLLVYKDIIAKNIFPQLTQLQATVVIFSIIGLTFFIVVISFYAWLASRENIEFKYVVVFMVLIFAVLAVMLVAGIAIYAWLATKDGMSFWQVLVFMILILTILAFLFVAIYRVTNNEQAEIAVGKTKPNEELPSEPPNPWYLKAIDAMNRGNQSIALEYVNRGLKAVPQNTPKQVASLLALKIKVLLLMGGSDNRAAAKHLADQSYGCYLKRLDTWIDCLRQQNLFSSMITTETELETRCSSSNYSNK